MGGNGRSGVAVVRRLITPSRMGMQTATLMMTFCQVFDIVLRGVSLFGCVIRVVGCEVVRCGF